MLALSQTSPVFLRVCSTSLLKTPWEKKKLLVTSNFFFSRSVFYLFDRNIRAKFSNVLNFFKHVTQLFCRFSCLYYELYILVNYWNKIFQLTRTYTCIHVNKALTVKNGQNGMFWQMSSRLSAKENQDSLRP